MEFRPIKPARIPCPTVEKPLQNSRKLVVKACDRCRMRKTKCSGTRPRCSNCEKTSLDCVYRGDKEEKDNNLETLKTFTEKLRKLPQKEAERLLYAWRSSDGKIESLSKILHVPKEPGSVPASVSGPQVLTSREQTASFVDAFFSTNDQLFHVFSKDQVEKYIHLCYDEDSQKQPANTCCLLAVAAVGCSQYRHEVVDKQLQPRRTFYDLARDHFESARDIQPPDAIKVFAMLCLYNITSSADEAARYAEKGMELYRKHTTGLAADSPELVELGRTWRALVIMSSWLYSWLSDERGTALWKCLSDTEPMQLENNTSTNLEGIVQSEMLKVSLLNAQARQTLRASKELTAHSLQTSQDELIAWYNSLPLNLKLEAMVEHDASTRLSLWRTYLLHLGGMMLCYRQIAAQGSPEQDNPLFKLKWDAVDAAMASAGTFRLLLDSGEVPKRCWLSSSHASMSCAILLHHCTQELANGTNAWEDAKMGASHSFGVLESCSQLDPVTAQAYTQLLSASRILDILRTKSNLMSLSAAESLTRSISASMLSMMEIPNQPALNYLHDLFDLLGSAYDA
ncbi:hypothetical protein PG988_006589 [Apiospora saccharicola]